MKFTDALAEAERPRTRPCKLGRALSRMDPDDREAFAAAAASDVPWSALHRAVTRLGHDMTYSTVQRHLRGDCGCDG